MEKTYYILCRVDSVGSKSYVYEMNASSVYTDKDYTKGLRFLSKDVAVGIAIELSSISGDYSYNAVEVKTTITDIE